MDVARRIADLRSDWQRCKRGAPRWLITVLGTLWAFFITQLFERCQPPKSKNTLIKLAATVQVQVSSRENFSWKKQRPTCSASSFRLNLFGWFWYAVFKLKSLLANFYFFLIFGKPSIYPRQFYSFEIFKLSVFDLESWDISKKIWNKIKIKLKFNPSWYFFELSGFVSKNLDPKILCCSFPNSITSWT